MRIQTSEDLDSIRKKGLQKIQPRGLRIGVGTSSCGIAVGGMALYNRLDEIIQTKNLDISLVKTDVSVLQRGADCISKHPRKALVLLRKVKPDDVERIISLALHVMFHLIECSVQFPTGTISPETLSME
jgi:hypothetical protein